MIFNIISTGSKGNAVILNNCILIDCGVPFKSLDPYYKELRLVLLTHIHCDHFNPSTISRLHRERPTLRFACCKWMVKPLMDAGVNISNIDMLEPDTQYIYNICTIQPFELVHDVPNAGYKIHMDKKSIFYATDTDNLRGIEAREYDLYMVEGNYCENEIKQRMADKRQQGIYTYEHRVLKNHLSIQQAEEWIFKNAGINSQYILIHGHEAVEDVNR